MTEKEKRVLSRQQMQPKTAKITFIAAICMMIVFTFVILWRLFVLQIVDGELYVKLAREQQLKDEPIPAVRGEIYDATGKVLAANNPLWNVTCSPIYSNGLYTKIDKEGGEPGEKERVLDPVMCADITAALTPLLVANDGTLGEGVDVTSEAYLTMYQTVYNAFSNVNSKYQPLLKNVELPTKLAVEAFIAEYNKREFLDSEGKEKNVAMVVDCEDVSSRVYPYGQFAASVLGFCNSDGDGFYGLEASYDDILAGTDGRRMAVTDVFGGDVAVDTATDITYEAQNGSNLHLALDVNVQQVAEHYLEEAIAANNVENRGVCIVMDVNTGAILAMATKADYDPNTPTKILEEDYLSAMILNEPEIYAQYQLDANGKPLLDALGYEIIDTQADYTKTMREIQWKNKAITELYYPGSIFKIFVAAAAIDAGIATRDTAFMCDGAYYVEGKEKPYTCAGHVRHGAIGMADAIRSSCNIYFIQLAEKLGAERFYDYYNAFGFTAPTGVDLPYETRYMQYYTDKTLGTSQLASSGFGQVQVMTPLQMCTGIAACVNGGYLVTPHIVSKITDENGNVIEEAQTEIKRQVISENASDIICDLMEYEVGYGTTTSGGYRSYVAGYRIGGKSGTSEQLNMNMRIEDGDYKKVSSFVATVPANDPEILVYLMLDDPNNPETDYASVLAAPAVGNIISEIAPYLGISTNGVDLSEETVKVPNLVGKQWSVGQVDLNRKGLQHSLETDLEDITAAKVTYQYPSAGMEVAGGTTIYSYIGQTEGTMVNVPNVVGKTSTFAQQMLFASGLNCVIIGDEAKPVKEQSVSTGTSAEMGTIITLVCEE